MSLSGFVSFFRGAYLRRGVSVEGSIMDFYGNLFPLIFCITSIFVNNVCKKQSGAKFFLLKNTTDLKERVKCNQTGQIRCFTTQKIVSILITGGKAIAHELN